MCRYLTVQKKKESGSTDNFFMRSLRGGDIHRNGQSA
jgi:hypothetical protein